MALVFLAARASRVWQDLGVWSEGLFLIYSEFSFLPKSEPWRAVRGELAVVDEVRIFGLGETLDKLRKQRVHISKLIGWRDIPANHLISGPVYLVPGISLLTSRPQLLA